MLAEIKLHFIFMLLVFSYCCRDEVFLEQPGPGPVVAPIGTQVQLNCSVVEGQKRVWYFYQPDSAAILSTDQPGVLESLRGRGITVESSLFNSSLFIIAATEMSNQTEVSCVAIDRRDPLIRCQSHRIRMMFFGPPYIPVNFMATENGVGSLRISWSSTFSIEGVTVEFTLTATDLNTSNSTIMRGIQEQHYNFTVEDSSSCDIYTFQVTALNAAGSSGPSEMLTRSLPSLPDISAVENSLEQSLVKTADGVTLSVMFQGITSCPEYPVTSYTLVVVDSEGNETRESSLVYYSGETVLLVAELEEESLYICAIVATNVIGNSVSTLVWNQTTTDVQGIIFGLIKDFTYSIQCSYITGSDARGCVYTLVSGVEKVANITGTIDRNSSEGIQIDLPNAGDFVELLVFDWERDNSTGTVPVRQQLFLETLLYTTSGLLTTFSDATLSSDVVSSHSLSLTFVIMIVLASVLLTFFLFVIVIGCFIKRTRQVNSKNNDKSIDELYETINEVAKSYQPGTSEKAEGNDQFEENPSYGVAYKKGDEVYFNFNPSYGVLKTGDDCLMERVYEQIPN